MGDAAATSTDQPLTPHSPACPPEACTWRPQVRPPPRRQSFVRVCPRCPSNARAALPQVEQRPSPGSSAPLAASGDPPLAESAGDTAEVAATATASIESRRPPPSSGHTGASTPPLEALEAARNTATTPLDAPARDSPPLLSQDPARDTHVPGSGGGGDRGWTRWWESGGQHPVAEVTKMEVTRPEDKLCAAPDRPASPAEAKLKPSPALRHHDGQCPHVLAHAHHTPSLSALTRSSVH